MRTTAICPVSPCWKRKEAIFAETISVCVLQPFYSTDRITQLVKDVEQHLKTLLIDEHGASLNGASS